MANPTSNYSWQMPESTDLVTNLPADFEVFGQAVDSTVFANAADALSATIVDAKGDLIAATAANAVARLAVGANNTVLTADSATATGIKWAATAVSGKVLQVVAATTSTTTASTVDTYADTSLTATITPTLNTSKILVLVSQNGLSKDGSTWGAIRLVRTSTTLINFETQFAYNGASDKQNVAGSSASFLDSPATTSATTYKTTFANVSSSGVIRVQESSASSTILLMEIGA